MLEALSSFSHPILQHSSIGLFTLLALGIVGLPIPDETLLVSAGFLMTRGKLPIAPTIIAAYAGSLCGITLSYIIGLTAGSYIVTQYGHWIGVTSKKIESAQKWFHRIGKWALSVGYFIPGVRHLTGYVAGTLRVSKQEFAAFAYSGAVVWVSTFLLIGFFIAQ